MKKFMKLSDAKKLHSDLGDYIHLVENYDVSQLDSWVIKNYALTNSIANVIRNARAELHECNDVINHQFIVQVLQGKPKDQLHKIVRRGYLHKIKRNYS